MNQKEKASWEFTRVGGKTRFILTRGVLAWGVPMALFMLAKDHFADGEELKLLNLLFVSVINLIGGYFFGLILWIFSEKSYRG